MPPEQALATSEAIALSPPPGPPAATKVRVPTKDGAKEIRGKLKRALDLLVYGDEHGKPVQWDEAARRAEYTLQSMRKALERPHVMRYLREQKQVFRSSVSAANILVARQIRDDGENDNARMKAISYLDGETARQQPDGAGKHVTPGVVVHIAVNASAPAAADDMLIEVNPAQSEGTSEA